MFLTATREGGEVIPMGKSRRHLIVFAFKNSLSSKVAMVVTDEFSAVDTRAESWKTLQQRDKFEQTMISTKVIIVLREEEDQARETKKPE